MWRSKTFLGSVANSASYLSLIFKPLFSFASSFCGLCFSTAASVPVILRRPLFLSYCVLAHWETRGSMRFFYLHFLSCEYLMACYDDEYIQCRTTPVSYFLSLMQNVEWMPRISSPGTIFLPWRPEDPYYHLGTWLLILSGCGLGLWLPTSRAPVWDDDDDEDDDESLIRGLHGENSRFGRWGDGVKTGQKRGS